MARRPAVVSGRRDSVDLTHALLARLGLPPDASPADVAAAQKRISAFLASAPLSLQPWAQQQAASANAVVTLLSAEEAKATGTVMPVSGRADSEPDGDIDPDGYFDEDDFALDEHSRAMSGTGVAPAPHIPGQTEGARNQEGPRAAKGKVRPVPIPRSGHRTRLSRLALVVVIVIVTAIVVGVYKWGDSGVESPSPNAATTSQTAQPLDEAKVAALMTKLQANPKDVATLRELGRLYFQAGDFLTAATWQQRIVDGNPKDVDARLALGVALFNSGDPQAAEQHFLKAVELAPNLAEAHYDLGFLYLSKSPPDMEKAKAAWEKVIEIDPDSELAKIVSTHMPDLSGKAASPIPADEGKQ